jgi:hypothetical protein
MSIRLLTKPTETEAPDVASKPNPVRIVSSAPTQSMAPSTSRWPVALVRSLRISARDLPLVLIKEVYSPEFGSEGEFRIDPTRLQHARDLRE